MMSDGLKVPLSDYYNSIAPGYDALYGEEQRKKLEIVREFIESDLDLKLTRGIILVDVGCGTGISTTILPVYCVGIDPAIELLRQADIARLELNRCINDEQTQTSHSKYLGNILGLSEALPIKNRASTITVSVTAVHNFIDIKTGIQEIVRITTERVVISILKRAKQLDEIMKMINKYHSFFTSMFPS